MGIPKNTIIHANFNDSVAVDFKSDGSFNATLAAKYFGKESKDWLRLDSTRDYISAFVQQAKRTNPLFEENQLVMVKKGSPENGGGTWLHEDLAVAFARWLNADFGVWCDYQIKQILREQIYSADLDKALALFPKALKVAKLIGLGKNEATLSANRLVSKQTNINVLEMLGHETLVSESQEIDYTPTQIGDSLNLSGQAVNKILEAIGFQFKVGEVWNATKEGEKYSIVREANKQFSEGTKNQLRWYLSVVDVLKGYLDANPIPLKKKVKHLEVVQ
jgi:KilA-N domain